MSTTEAPIREAREALAERLFEALIGTMELACVHIGDRLGLYAALDEGGPQTSAELAARAGVDERYGREWLEQQAVAGVLTVDDPRRPAAERRYALPEGHREGLLDRRQPALRRARWRACRWACSHPLEKMIEAFRTGEGVPYPDYGPDTREGIAAFNRPMFVNQLAQEWLPVDPRRRRAPAREPPGPRRRRRLRLGLVERRARAPRTRWRGWTASTRTRRRSPPPARSPRSAASATGCASSCRTRATRGSAGRATTW